MNLTTGKFAKKYELSRSTLLYYDKIGLLSPCSPQAEFLYGEAFSPAFSTRKVC